MADRLSPLEEKVRESVMLRGIAASLNNMAMPTINNLNDLLKIYGYQVVKR